MGIAADRLDNLRIEANSPDGQLTGSLRPPGQLSVRFRDGGLRHYTERGLERQLSALLEKLWRDYHGARRAAVAEAIGKPVDDDPPWDARSRRYRAERDATTFEGMSDGDYVYVSSTGLRGWHVVVRDGCLSALDEEALAAEVASGYTALMHGCQLKLNQLRDKHFPR